jgi:hypothetical protein
MTVSDGKPAPWAGNDRTGPGGTQVYRTSPWLRGLLAVAFVALAGGAVAVGVFDVLPEPAGGRGMAVVLAMFAAFSWYFWALARRRRVIIDDGGITLVEWKKPLRLERSELRGYRRSYNNNAFDLHFETTKIGRRIPVRVLTSMDSAFDAWLQRVPELDAATESAAQRLAFDRDRPIARAVNRVALALGALSLVPIGFQRGAHAGPWVWLAAIPFLAPLAALAIVLRGRGRFTIVERGRDDPRPTLFLTFVLPPLMAALGPVIRFETLSIGAVFAAAAVASTLLCALTWFCDRSLRGRRALVLLLLAPLMSIPLLSAVLVVNCAVDDSPPDVHSATVLRKIHTTGKGGGYFLELAPWEPGMRSERLRVSWDVFAGAREGRPVPVLTRSGRLGFRWAWVGGVSAPSPSASLPASESGAVDWSRDFAHHHRGRIFDLHYQRADWDAAAFTRVADAFVDLVDRDFVPVRLERRLDVIVLPDRASFHHYLREVLRIDLTPTGIYLPALRVFATYEDSGLGTFTHEIMHAVVERSLPDCPRWALEGVPAFFEKFLGYWDGGRLVVQWGFQNPWRLQVLGDGLQGLDLARIVAADRPYPGAAASSAERLVAVFLWQHGRLERFLQLVAARDRAGFASYFEAAMQRPLAEIVPLWQAYLADLVANRAEALRIPPSTVYVDRAAFEKGLAELRPWLAPGVSR